MANFALRLRQLRTERNLSQQNLADQLGFTKSRVSMYERGEREPAIETIEEIADYFNVDLDYLTGRSDIPNRTQDIALQKPPAISSINLAHLQRIPILGRIAAGLPLYAEEQIDGYTFTDLNGGAEYFALRVQGDSMNAMGINDGYLIIVRRQEEVENGEVAVVMVGEENATVKRFYAAENIITLLPQSTNPIHQPQIYDLSKISVKVLGKVVKAEFTI